MWEKLNFGTKPQRETDTKRLRYAVVDGPQATEEGTTEGFEDDKGRRPVDAGWNDQCAV